MLVEGLICVNDSVKCCCEGVGNKNGGGSRIGLYVGFTEFRSLEPRRATSFVPCSPSSRLKDQERLRVKDQVQRARPGFIDLYTKEGVSYTKNNSILRDNRIEGLKML